MIESLLARALFRGIFNKYMIGAVVIITAATAFWIQHQNLQIVKRDLAIEAQNRVLLEGAIETQENTISTLQSDFQAQIEQVKEHAAEISEIHKKTEDNRTTLSGYRSRLDRVANARPELIQKKANDSFGALLQDLAK